MTVVYDCDVVDRNVVSVPYAEEDDENTGRLEGVGELKLRLNGKMESSMSLITRLQWSRQPGDSSRAKYAQLCTVARVRSI
jgi:hypothetical protein